MKLIHLSDLHLGIRLKEYSLIDDQNYILKEIIEIIDNEKPDGVIIAGDVYDKSVPSAEAVSLFDSFLYDLAKRKLQVFIISGNHDSAERIAFGSRIMDASGIHLSPIFNGTVEPIRLKDEFGTVNVFMLPFLKPAAVHRFYEDETINDYTDAIGCVINHMNVDESERNVLVTHQFVTGALRSDSEETPVGGLDNVNADVFAPFDYVALGHLHSPQNCGSDRIRYCGTPLKYSFSEARDQKSVTVTELNEKGNVICKTVDLRPLHDMIELRGTYEELTLKSYYEGTTWPSDFTHITLTDEQDVPEAFAKLRVIYTNLLTVDYDNTRTRTDSIITGADEVEKKSPFELFAELYELQNGLPMSEEHSAYMKELIEKTWEDEA